MNLRCDRQGKVVEQIYSPDHKIRLEAAAQFLKLMGAYAPQKLDVEIGVTDDLMELEEKKLMMRVAELVGQAAQDNPEVRTRFEQSVENGPRQGAGTSPVRGGGESAEGAEGRLLLGDAMHENV